jgi:hypothetical protein
MNQCYVNTNINYINTNIHYIEPNFEKRLEQHFEIGDVVMIGPAYILTIDGVDVYKDDELTGQVVKIEECENNISPVFTNSPIYQVFIKVSGKDKEFLTYASRLILVRSRV